MAHQPNYQRRSNLNIAPPQPDPQTSKPTTDLTAKRHYKPSNTSTTTTTTKATTSAVYNLTNHFSRLHPNNTKTQNPLPKTCLIDTHLQVKALSKSANFDHHHQTQKIIPSKQVTNKRVVLESDKKSLVVVEDNKREGNKSKNEIFKPKTTTVISKRRSFCDAQVELANFLVTNCAKVVSADMSPFMQIHAVGLARKTKDSLEKFTSKTLALSLKKEFDGAYGPAWHCIVGTSFGSFVTHSVGGFIYFSLDQKLYVLLFKTSVQRAE